MGAVGKNFYNDLAVAYGYEKEAKLIQELYLSGKKRRPRLPSRTSSASS